MNDYEFDYYHGLAGYYPIINVKESIELSLKQLEQILSSGGIYSKSMRNKLDLSTDGKPVYNGDDYISICIKNIPRSEFEGINEGLDSTYNKYVVDKLAIVIDKSIYNECEFREGEYEKLPGERQVKDKIDIKYFKAIRVGYLYPAINQIVCEIVKELLDKYNIDLPIIDSNDTLIGERTK